jgi:hypothetical protein
MLFVAVLLILGGVLLMVGSQIDGSSGGIFSDGLGCVVLGALTAWGGMRLQKRVSPPPARGRLDDSPEVSLLRMEQAEAAYEHGDLAKAFESLWDEFYLASRRGDNQRLEAVRALAEKIRQTAPKRRTRATASHLVGKAATRLDPVATAPPLP